MFVLVEDTAVSSGIHHLDKLHTKFLYEVYQDGEKVLLSTPCHDENRTHNLNNYRN